MWCCKKPFLPASKSPMAMDAGNTLSNFHGKNSIELDLYVRENFMAPLQALTATKDAAEAIGMSDRLERWKRIKLRIVWCSKKPVGRYRMSIGLEKHSNGL